MVALVTGGAGYIGSHTILHLLKSGRDVLVADNFSTSSPRVFRRLATIAQRDIPFADVDLRNQENVDRLFDACDISEVVHFAGLKAAGESVQRPLDYYDNNVVATMNLLKSMRRHGVTTLVFSSSATVYGHTDELPTTELCPIRPTTPYGRSKAMVEQILSDVASAERDWRFALLRYFNPAGAHPSGAIGEDPKGSPSNLVPLITQVAAGRRAAVTVFGDDYPTPDGTGVRDYIHVEDIAEGHVAALDHLHISPGCRVFNLGTGTGASVLQLINAFSAVTGRTITTHVAGRRPGDIAMSLADPSRARRELLWCANRTLQDICADAWRWQQLNPRGYSDEPAQAMRPLLL